VYRASGDRFLGHESDSSITRNIATSLSGGPIAMYLREFELDQENEALGDTDVLEYCDNVDACQKPTELM
jgi:hypothetical protein